MVLVLVERGNAETVSVEQSFVRTLGCVPNFHVLPVVALDPGFGCEVIRVAGEGHLGDVGRVGHRLHHGVGIGVGLVAVVAVIRDDWRSAGDVAQFPKGTNEAVIIPATRVWRVVVLHLHENHREEALEKLDLPDCGSDSRILVRLSDNRLADWREVAPGQAGDPLQLTRCRSLDEIEPVDPWLEMKMAPPV